MLHQTLFSSLLQNGLGFFSVVMCNFCCIPWKEYLKENMYKVLFCVLKQRLSFLWGICVGGCGRDPPSMLLVFLHYLHGVTLHPQTWQALSSVWGSARSHTPGGVAQALGSPWWHWGAPDGTGGPGQSSWGFPLWRRGFCKGPAPGVLFKIHQGQAPEHLCSW